MYTKHAGNGMDDCQSHPNPLHKDYLVSLVQKAVHLLSMHGEEAHKSIIL